MIGFLVVNAGLQWVWPCCCGFLWVFFSRVSAGFYRFHAAHSTATPDRHRVAAEFFFSQYSC